MPQTQPWQQGSIVDDSSQGQGQVSIQPWQQGPIVDAPEPVQPTELEFDDDDQYNLLELQSLLDSLEPPIQPAISTSTLVEPPRSKVQELLDMNKDAEKTASDRGYLATEEDKKPDPSGIDDANRDYYVSQFGDPRPQPSIGQGKPPKEPSELTAEDVGKAQAYVIMDNMAKKYGVKDARNRLKASGAIDPRFQVFVDGFLGIASGGAADLLTTPAEEGAFGLFGMLAGFYAPSKIISGAGVVSKTALRASRLGAGETAASLAGRAIGSAATFGLRSSSEVAAQIANDEEVTVNEAARHITNMTLFGGGLGITGGIPSPALRIPAEGMYGYLSSYLQGASQEDALITGLLFMGMGMMNTRNVKYDVRNAGLKHVIEQTEKDMASIGVPKQAFPKLRAMMYESWSRKVNPTLQDLIKLQDEATAIVKGFKTGQVKPLELAPGAKSVGAAAKQLAPIDKPKPKPDKPVKPDVAPVKQDVSHETPATKPKAEPPVAESAQQAEPVTPPVEIEPAAKPVAVAVEKVPQKGAESAKPGETLALEFGKPPEKPAEKPVEPSEPEFVGLNVEENETIRAAIGRESLDPVQRKTWEATIANAKFSKFDETAVETADEAIRTGRQITDEEHVGMLLKLGNLVNEQKAVIKDRNDLIEKGDIAAAQIARARENVLIDRIDTLTEGTRLARREAARLLGAGRMRLNLETYDIVAVKQQAQAAKGSKLTEAESNALEARTADVERREADLQKLEDEFAAKQFADAERKAKAMVSVHKRAAKSKKFTGLEAVLAERETLKKQIGDLGFRVNDVTGLTAEGSYLVGKLAVNYIKEGTLTLPGVIKKVRSDVPELTDNDVIHALNAKDPRRQAKAKSETIKRIANLKLQAKLIGQVEQAEQGVFDLPKKTAPKGAQIRILQNRLRDLRAQAYKSGVHPDQLERTITTINQLQDQLDNHFRTVRARRTIPEGELAQAKEKIELLRKQLRVEDDLLNLREQLRTGDFVIRERPVPKEVPPDLERAQIDLRRARKKVRTAIDAMAPLTPRKLGVEAINTLRTLKATFDMSGTLRQGLVLTARRPIVATKIFKKSFETFFSQYSADQIDNNIRSADHHYLRERAGLQLTDPDGTLTSREEEFGALMIEKMPIIGTVIKAANRHMVSHLNLLRVAVFDEFLIKNPNATGEELEAWADWVNVATGRGDLGKAAAFANILSLFVFAPRFAVSRIQTPFKVFQHWKNPRVRKEIAKDMVALAGLGATILALAKLAGYEVGDDPREPDFGKIQVGNTRIDIWGGLQQPMRLLTRVGLAVTDKAEITGKELSEREKNVDPLELLGRFAAYKLAPSVTLPMELLKGKTAVGEETTPSKTAAKAMLPLWLEDVADAYRDAGAARAAGVGVLTFLGVGASTYKRSRASMVRRIRKMKIEVESLKEQGRLEEAEALNERRKAEQVAWNRDPDNKDRQKIRTVRTKPKPKPKGK